MTRELLTPETRDALDDDHERRRAEWHLYYSEKRIVQQWMQVHLLADLPIRRVLEVGPYLGLATAMLDNAGYDVTTLDLFQPPFRRPQRPHIEANLIGMSPETIEGFDAILCCETLEHLPWEEACRVLATFHASGARFLVLSVPYEGAQFYHHIYLNPFMLRHRMASRKTNRFRRFKPDPDPWGHKWELGFRGYSVKRWERAIRDAGWTIRRREFTASCRSAFHLCERSG